MSIWAIVLDIRFLLSYKRGSKQAEVEKPRNRIYIGRTSSAIAQELITSTFLSSSLIISRLHIFMITHLRQGRCFICKKQSFFSSILRDFQNEYRKSLEKRACRYPFHLPWAMRAIQRKCKDLANSTRLLCSQVSFCDVSLLHITSPSGFSR